MEVSDVRRVESLEEENRHLKQLVAENEPSIQGLRTAPARKY